LVKEEGEGYLAHEVVEQIQKAINYAYEQLDIVDRNLATVTQYLSIDFPRWTSLRRWLKGKDHYPDGEYAYLFGHETDSFNFDQKMGFDLTHFLDHKPKTVLTALMMYLFHRIEESLDGSLVSIYLDEGWQYLDNFYWQHKLKKWLPTLRKLNCHLVLATQSPSSVVESPLKNIILDNSATQIYFVNPQTDQKYYIDGFHLTESEFEIIKHADPSTRLFLVKQEHQSSVCQLNLSFLEDYLTVLSGNKKTVQLLDHLRKEVGNDPKVWLPLFYEKRKAL